MSVFFWQQVLTLAYLGEFVMRLVTLGYKNSGLPLRAVRFLVRARNRREQHKVASVEVL